jgi:drug/metabolite transporter (DMT)-like permease
MFEIWGIIIYLMLCASAGNWAANNGESRLTATALSLLFSPLVDFAFVLSTLDFRKK